MLPIRHSFSGCYLATWLDKLFSSNLCKANSLGNFQAHFNDKSNSQVMYQGRFGVLLSHGQTRQAKELTPMPYLFHIIFICAIWFNQQCTHFVSQHKKSLKGQLFILLTIFQISGVKFSSQKVGPPLPCPLELPYLCYTTSVV